MVSASRVAILSLRRTGTPCSPPVSRPPKGRVRGLPERARIDLADGVQQWVEAADLVAAKVRLLLLKQRWMAARVASWNSKPCKTPVVATSQT